MYKLLLLTFLLLGCDLKSNLSPRSFKIGDVVQLKLNTNYIGTIDSLREWRDGKPTYVVKFIMDNPKKDWGVTRIFAFEFVKENEIEKIK